MANQPDFRAQMRQSGPRITRRCQPDPIKAAPEPAMLMQKSAFVQGSCHPTDRIRSLRTSTAQAFGANRRSSARNTCRQRTRNPILSVQRSPGRKKSPRALMRERERKRDYAGACRPVSFGDRLAVSSIAPRTPTLAEWCGAKSLPSDCTCRGSTLVRSPGCCCPGKEYRSCFPCSGS